VGAGSGGGGSGAREGSRTGGCRRRAADSVAGTWGDERGGENRGGKVGQGARR
jgi:hypothetical protein